MEKLIIEIIEGFSKECERLSAELETGRYSVNDIMWQLDDMAEWLAFLAEDMKHKEQSK